MVELQIHNYNFIIELRPYGGPEDVVYGYAEPGTCGETLMCHNRILINDDLAPEVMKWTITHELVHAYLWSYGFDALTTFSHEQVCEFIASYVEEISRDTEIVYTALTAELQECEDSGK